MHGPLAQLLITEHITHKQEYVNFWLSAMCVVQLYYNKTVSKPFTLVARCTSVTSLTLARVRVDTVVASGTILAWAALTVVDYCNTYNFCTTCKYIHTFTKRVNIVIYPTCSS